ncbi:MAG: hypothetical protein ABL949_08180, partial [Fimbriimonadaceae bacterium]
MRTWILCLLFALVASSRAATYGVKWLTDLGGTANESLHGMRVISLTNGTFVGVGYESTLGGGPKLVIRGYDATGQVLWTRFRPVGQFESIGNIVSAADNFGNFYVTFGHEELVDFRDIVTIKYNSSGQEIWARSLDFANNGEDYPNAITVDFAGNPAIVLSTAGRIGIIRYTKDGVLMFRHAYGSVGSGAQREVGEQIAYDSQRNI